MNRFSIITLMSALVVTATILLCNDLPSNTADDPNNVTVSLFLEDESTSIEIGSRTRIGLAVSYPVHVEKLHLRTACADFDTTVLMVSTEPVDILFFNPVFTREGPCTLYVNAVLSGKRLQDKTDTLPINVLPKSPAITFTQVPAGFATFLGRTDTLLFIASTGNDASPIQFLFTSEPPLDNSHLYSPATESGNARRCVFTPDTTDSFTIMVHAASGSMEGYTNVGIRVYDSLTFAFLDVPHSIMTGDTDTLVFAVDRGRRPDSLRMELINGSAFDTATVKILPSGADTLLIAVSPKSTGKLPIVVRITNGAVSDTSWFIVNTIDSAYALWNEPAVNLNAIEGTPLSIDLRQHLFTPIPEGLTFSTNAGKITYDTLWKWTPEWGCDPNVTVTIKAEDEAGIYLFNVYLAVQPGDSTSPSVRLLDPSFYDTTIGLSQIAIEAVVTDSAGIGKVTFSTGANTIEAAEHRDSIYSAIIPDLAHGVYTEVTITACDQSMNKNCSPLVFHVKYDSTLKDKAPPLIAIVDGPQNNERVTDPMGEMTFAVADSSGVDSVWWTLNGVYVEALEEQRNGNYSLSYTLPNYGSNLITLHARDNSLDYNHDSLEITLIYNTFPNAITIIKPRNGAVEVDTLPTFSWSGGEDADGNSVFYRVIYAAAETWLTDELTVKSFTFTAENKLSPATTYLWQVIAYSKIFPDTSFTETYSFTTTGTVPVITVSPKSDSVYDGDNASFSVTVSGTKPFTYQWFKNNAVIAGATTATFKITATLADSGATVQCIVTNAFGIDTSGKATLTVIPEPPVIVSFESNGGTAVDTQFIQSGSYATEPDPPPTKSGYEFGGWFTNRSLGTAFDFSNTPITANERIYAKWIAVYTVTYDDNGSDGGSIFASVKNYHPGDTVEILGNNGNLSKEGYSFDGWNTNPDGTGSDRIPGEAFVMGSENVVLYAKWVMGSE